MGYKRKNLLLEVAIDDVFTNSYWTFDWRRAVHKASQNFRQQFGVGFRIVEAAKWNSVGTLDLVDYPDNFIKRIPHGALPEDILDGFLKLTQECGLSINIDYEEERGRFRKHLGGHYSSGYRAGFMAGWLDEWRDRCLLRDLKTQFSRDDIDVVVGFTGKKIKIEPGRSLLGGSDGEKYAIIGVYYYKIDMIIIHEVAHCLGATHCDDDQNSIMRYSLSCDTYDFDKSNKTIILKNLQDRLGCW